MSKLGGDSCITRVGFNKNNIKTSIVEFEYLSNRSKPQLPRFAIMRNHNEPGYL
jgi:hypothetical protein